MAKTTVKKNAAESFSGIYDNSRVFIVSNPELNSVSFASYSNETQSGEIQPWTLFMSPDEAKRMAKTILGLFK